jgi:hypothetical protein
MCFLGVKRRRCVRLTNSPPSESGLSGQRGILDISQHYRLPTACYEDSFTSAQASIIPSHQPVYHHTIYWTWYKLTPLCHITCVQDIVCCRIILHDFWEEITLRAGAWGGALMNKFKGSAIGQRHERVGFTSPVPVHRSPVSQNKHMI